jgi:hypothetical protein
LEGTPVTYTVLIPEQLDQLPIARLIRPRSRVDVHHHGIVLTDPSI